MGLNPRFEDRVMGRITSTVFGVANEAPNVAVNIPAALLPQGKVVQYDLTFNGNATLADIARILVLAGGIPVWNLAVAATGTHYQAFMSRFSGVSVNPADAGISIPFWFLDEVGQLERDSCQVVPGMPISLQIQFLNTFVAGANPAIDVMATITDVEPAWTPLVTSSAMGILANQNNRPYDPKTSGLLRGFSINTTALNAFNFNAGAVQMYNGNTGAQLIQAEGSKYPSPGSTGRIVDPIMVKTLPWRPMNAGGTMVQISTGAGWGGANNEFGTYTVVPIVKGAPSMPLVAGSPAA
jgi:hypothetical protein